MSGRASSLPKRRLCPGRSWGLLDTPEFPDAPIDVPILDIEVAVLVPIGAMRAAESAFDPLVLRAVVVRSLRRIRIVAEHSDDGVVLVENIEPAVQVGH